MYKKGIYILFSLFFSYALLEHPSAQEQKQDIVPPPGNSEAQAGPVVPKQVLNIEIRDNLLNVELVDAEFGDVLKDIALKSGFRFEISGDVSGKKLTTKFGGMEIERGIIRLLSLINEKNYMFYYDTKGALSGLDIYGGTAAAPVANAKPQLPVRPQPQRFGRPSPVPTPAPVMQRPAKITPTPTLTPIAQKPAKISPIPTPAPVVQKPAIITPAPTPAEQKMPLVQKNPPPGLRRLLSPSVAKQLESQTPTPSPTPAPTQPDVGPTEPAAQENVEQNVEEAPYIPSPRTPTYIPPKAQ